jgi:hypothetical protein
LQTIHMDVTKAMNMTAYGNQRPPLTQWIRFMLNSITPQRIWQWAM